MATGTFIEGVVVPKYDDLPAFQPPKSDTAPTNPQKLLGGEDFQTKIGYGLVVLDGRPPSMLKARELRYSRIVFVNIADMEAVFIGLR